ncbi:unnamed protein product [Penicillium salamii]|nr:unnamed protein product [Penicillium salamii]
MGVTPSDALRLMLAYIADNERLPFKQTSLSDEDAALVDIVKERLRNPEPVRRALKEWRKLGPTVREQLKKKLAECLESPRIEANKLSRMPDCYKIKLKSSGYRLAYQVIDDRVVVFVVAVGKRERSEVNSAASRHLS